MTHYLRSKHDSIFIGIGTVLADDPKLNCRYDEKSTIRPIILDPKAQWKYEKVPFVKFVMMVWDCSFYNN